MLLLKDNNARVSLEGAEVAGPAINVREERENAKSVPYSLQTGRHPRPVFALPLHSMLPTLLFTLDPFCCMVFRYDTLVCLCGSSNRHPAVPGGDFGGNVSISEATGISNSALSHLNPI